MFSEELPSFYAATISKQNLPASSSLKAISRASFDVCRIRVREVDLSVSAVVAVAAVMAVAK